MPLPQPDLGVLRKAQRGDERAFSIIVRTYEQPVYNYVLRLTGDRSLSEDLTQEVFLRVFQGLPSFSLRSRFTTWLFQVTKNRVLDELRAIERRPRVRGQHRGRAAARGRRCAGRARRDDRRGLESGRGPQSRPEDGASSARRRRALVHGDRRDARGDARHGEVADLQGARGSSARAPSRRRRGSDHARHPRPRAGSPRRLRWARDAPVCPGSRRTARRRAHRARRLSRHARAAGRRRARRLRDERRAEARRPAEATSA